MNVVADLMHRAMEDNARVAQDQEEYNKKYTALERRYNKADAAYKSADAQIERQKARSRQLGHLIKQLKELDGPVAEFDAGLWGVFIEKMTVNDDRSKVMRFKDGTEITV